MGDTLTGVKLTTDKQHETDCINACVTRIVSTRIIKRMTGYCISNIFSERKLLPPSCFRTEVLGTNQIKVLKRDVNFPKAVETNKWLFGILDAIEKNYVSKLTISIFKDDSCKTLIEKYTFAYKYLDYDKREKISPESSLEVKVLYNKTIELFQSLLTTLSLLKPLPPDPIVEVYITYNDSKITIKYIDLRAYNQMKLTLGKPDFYIAPCFEQTEIKSPTDDNQEILSINHVRLSTPFHKMSAHSSYNKIYHKCLTSKMIPTEDNALHCFCGFSGEYCETFVCSICKKCSHSCCYGKIPNPDISISSVDHFPEVCLKCYCENPEKLICSDMTLINFSIEKRKVISLIRRGLFFCLQFNKFTYSDLKHYNGILKEDIKTIMNVLNKFQLITKKNNFFEINGDYRDSLILKWFNIHSEQSFEVMMNELDGNN